MGSVTVTVTDSVNDVFQTQSLHFESYKDFINYENGMVPTPASPPENKNNIYLTEDEIYTLRILLGHVADKECYRIQEKLELLDQDEIDCEDYDKLFLEVYINNTKHILEDDLKEITIRFKQEE